MAAKKRPRQRGCFSSVVRFTFIILVLFAIGFFIFYAIDNPDFLSNIKSRFSSEEEQTTIAAEAMVLEEPAEAEPEEPIQDSQEEGISILDKIKAFFAGGSYEEEGSDLPARLTINFFFASLGQDMLLEAEQRTIVAGTLESALFNATTELLKGPSKPYLFPVIPGGTNLIEVEVYENLAKINLSQEFLDNSLDTRMLDELIIYSVVNTLTEIPGIEGVIFHIEGTRIKVYGNIDLSIPAIRNEEVIKIKEG